MTTSTRCTLAAGAIALAYLAWTFGSRTRAPNPAPPAYQDVLGLDKITSATILHFYTMPGTIIDGDKATLQGGETYVIPVSDIIKQAP